MAVARRAGVPGAGVRPSRAAGRNGFVLIDVLIAVVIAAAGMGAASGGVTASVRAARSLEKRVFESIDTRNSRAGAMYEEIASSRE